MALKLRSNKTSAKTTRTTNPNALFSKVQQRAYELYQKRGCCHGSDWNDWFEAERQIKRGMR